MSGIKDELTWFSPSLELIYFESMSGRKRSGKKAWDDLIDATSSKDGDPFEMLRGDLNEEQRELFKKLRGGLSF